MKRIFLKRVFPLVLIALMIFTATACEPAEGVGIRMTELNEKSKSSLLHVLVCDTHFSKVTRPLSIALTMTAASLVKCFSREMDKISYPLMKI